MKKIIIWLLALGGGLLVLLLAAVLIVPRFLDAESYLPTIEKKVTEATGRSFSLGKDVKVSVFPWVGASFTNLQMGNPETFGGGEFVKVESFEARVKLLPLLSKKIEIDKFVLNGPEIRLVKMADGSVNWAFAPKKTESATPAPETQQKEGGGALPISSLNVGEFAITDGRLIYTDMATEQTREISNLNLRLENVSLESPIGLTFSADYDGQPVSVKGTVGPIGKVPGEGTVKIDIVAKILKQLEVVVAGEIVEPVKEQKFNINLKVAAFSPRKLLEQLNVPFPVKTSDPSVLNNLQLDLRVQGSPASVSVSNSTVTLDDSVLKLEARVKDMAKPDIAFKMDLNTINLDRYLPEASSEKKKTEGQAGKSSSAEPAKIDYAPLRRLVLDGEVKVGELVAKGAKVQNVVVKITGKNGVFDLNPLSLDLYEGSVAMNGNFNVQKDRPLANIDFKTENVKAGPLLRDSVNKDVLRGTMNAAAQIVFAGDNATDIKKSLNGSGNLTFLDGAIVGIDIAEMGRSLAAGLAGTQKPTEKPTTDFAELKVPFNLVYGVFQTEDTSLLSPLLRVAASGSANLVNETLDMKVRPKIVGSLKGQGDSENRSGITVPILVQGTFAKPTFKPDVSALANEETIIEAIKNPESLKEKGKSLEETGKSLLKDLGIRK
jgi:AsmA protein